MGIFLDTFSMDTPAVVIIVSLIILVVLIQSIFFLYKGLKHAKRINLAKGVIKDTIKSSISFTIVPAIAILITVVILIGSLGGYSLPWLRLSVIGAITYELPAAEVVMNALGVSAISNGKEFVTVAFVMTFGIIVGLVAVPFVNKPISNKLYGLRTKNKEWMDILISAMFIGMISAFLGFVFSDVLIGIEGFIPVFIMIISAITMLIMGLIIKVTKLKVLENYAIPISMIIAMLSAIPITKLIMG